MAEDSGTDPRVRALAGVLWQQLGNGRHRFPAAGEDRDWILNRAAAALATADAADRAAGVIRVRRDDATLERIQDALDEASDASGSYILTGHGNVARSMAIAVLAALAGDQ